MCQIALSKKIEKVNLKNLVIYSSDSSEGSEINQATSLNFFLLVTINFSHKKIFCHKKILVTKKF